ncbi:MAG TPA: slipin family protein [Patescibacteria group bacterium]|nr:slipin family protein [Patescibacteria group bacterium]
MELVFVYIFVALVAGLLFFKKCFARAYVYQYQQGLMYRDGKFVRLLQPGRYTYRKARTEIAVVDKRSAMLNLPGQDILTRDNINIKVSLAGVYEITDAVRARHASQNYLAELYNHAQLALRDAVSGFTLDELLEKKLELDQLLLTKIVEKAEALGCTVSRLAVRDVMLPANLKKAFSGILEVKKEVQTQLEKARGEQAVLRSLSNAAQLFESNPHLLQARIIQTLSSGNNTVVFGADGRLTTK